MEKKLKIFSFPDKNPEYLQLQIDSYKKYMDDGNTEFIVLNTSMNYSDEIERICDDNKIKCIKFRTENKNQNDWLTHLLNQFHWFRDEMQTKIDDYILLMHADMFFINKLDYNSLMEDKKLYFTPQYRDTPIHRINEGNFNYFYMWDGLVLFDSGYFNQNDFTKLFDWTPFFGVTDFGGRTSQVLDVLDKNVYGFFEMWNYYNQRNNLVEFILNGNINYSFDVNEKMIRETIQMGNRSFPYEVENENYREYLVNKVSTIKEKFIDPYEYQPPINIDIIQLLNEPIENAPVLHFKSGSGYQNFHNVEYSNKKLEQIKKIIFKDEI
jgi:hypothetical protein